MRILKKLIITGIISTVLISSIVPVYANDAVVETQPTLAITTNFKTQENYVSDDCLAKKDDILVSSVVLETQKTSNDNVTLISTGNAEKNKKAFLKKQAEEKKKKEEEEERKKKEEEEKKNKEADEKETKAENSVSGNSTTTYSNSSNNQSTISKTPVQSDALVSIANPDSSYHGVIVSLTDTDRIALGHVVMGEAGTEGFVGASLLAQTLRDAMVYQGYSSISSVISGNQYDGWNGGSPNQDVLNAISYIFDQGGVAVQHKILYMYNPTICSSAWHESQNFICQWNDVRYFSPW